MIEYELSNVVEAEMSMKRIICMLLAISMVMCLTPMTSAANDESVEAANALYELGLFRGIGTNADGTPNFDLDRVPTRFEAVTMLVRLLGKEEEAVSHTWETPFTDIADWAAPYVGYAYENGLATGTGATTFDGGSAVNASQYLTFVLRALGYQSGTDFQWDKAWELSNQIGMTNGEYNGSDIFTRGDVAIISYHALGQKSKYADVSLIQMLQACSAVPQSQTLLSLLSKYGGVDYYSEYPVLPRVENVNLRAAWKKDQPTFGATRFIYKYPFTYEYEANMTYALYNSFLQANGFIINDTSNEYRNEYSVTVPSTGKTFTVSVSRIADGQPWTLNIDIPFNDVVTNDKSYDTYFSLSDYEINVERLGTITISAKVQSTKSIRIEWESFDSTIVMVSRQNTVVKDGYTESTVQIGGVQSGSTFVCANLYENDELYDIATCWVTVPVDMQLSPVKVTNITSKTNTVGGTTWTFDITNNSNKSMKYVTVYWRCYNTVGDILYDYISHSDRFSCRVTGPIEPGSTLARIQNVRPFYNYDFANTIGFIEIVIDYMDGTVEVVNPTNYYDYWDLN